MPLSLPRVAVRVTAPRTRPVTVVAHRGASAFAPENTLAAVRKAIGHGSDLIEVDVQRSRDGALVLLHDTTLTRTTNVRQLFPRRRPWLVGDFTFAELQRLDAGSWKSPDYAGERIPTLEQVVDVVAPSRSGLLLELKAPALYAGIVAEVAEVVRRSPLVATGSTPGRLVVESFDHDVMHRHKLLAPQVPVGLLGTPPVWQLDRLGVWADQVNPDHRLLTAGYVEAVHRHDMTCHVWTVNKLKHMHRALGHGVDGVITDRPDLLQDLADPLPLSR